MIYFAHIFHVYDLWSENEKIGRELNEIIFSPIIYNVQTKYAWSCILAVIFNKSYSAVFFALLFHTDLCRLDHDDAPIADNCINKTPNRKLVSLHLILMACTWVTQGHVHIADQFHCAVSLAILHNFCLLIFFWILRKLRHYFLATQKCFSINERTCRSSCIVDCLTHKMSWMTEGNKFNALCTLLNIFNL